MTTGSSPRPTPWQYKWKRPELHRPTTPNAAAAASISGGTTGTAVGGGSAAAGKDARSADEELLAGMVPISTSSAKLTAEEAARVVGLVEQEGGGSGDASKDEKGGRKAVEGRSIRLEDIIDGSAARKIGEDENEHDDDKDDDAERVLSVTVMAPAGKRKKKGRTTADRSSTSSLVGEVVLLEVTSFCGGGSGNEEQIIDDDDGNMLKRDISSSSSGGTVHVLLSRVLHWPSSALVETLDPVVEHDDDHDGHDDELHHDHDLEHEQQLHDDVGSSAQQPSVQVEWSRDEASVGTVGSGGHRPRRHQRQHDEHASVQSGLDTVGTWDTFLSTLHLRGKEGERRKKKERSIERRKVGIQSVSLCRRRRRGGGGGGNVDGTAGGGDNYEDALDTLRMLTLGMGDTPHHLEGALGTLAAGGGRNAVLETTTQGNDNMVRSEVGRSDLLICFLSNDGKVHMFDALKLLFDDDGEYVHNKDSRRPQGKSIGGEGKGEDMVDSLATLFFGDELLSKVKTKLVPLSKPDATVILSLFGSGSGKDEDGGPIPNRSGRITQEDVAPREDEGSHQVQSEVSSSKSDKDDPTESSKFTTGFLDLSQFDSTIEPTTAHYRTIRNKPTLCAAAFNYVAVGGKGIRRLRRKKPKSRKGVTRSSPPSSPSRSADGDYAERVALRGDSDHKEDTGRISNISAPSRADGEPVSSSILDKELSGREQDERTMTSTTARENREKEKQEWEWEYYYVAGGFITFVSLEHCNESKTVFLPFRPKTISPVVWDSKHFVIVLADDIHQSDGTLFPSSLPKAVAIRVDSSSRHSPDLQNLSPAASHPLMIGTAEEKSPHMSALSSTPEKSEIRQSYLADTKLQQEFLVRRFVPLAIVLPDMAPKDCDLVSVTSMLTSPPAIVTSHLVQSHHHAVAEKHVKICLNTLSGFDIDAIRGKESIVIRSQVYPGHFACLPLASASCKPKVWCINGQGWSVAGIEEDDLPYNARFITWEGATTLSGAHATTLVECRQGSSATFFSNAVTSHVLPANTFLVRGDTYRREKHAKSRGKPQVQLVKMPFVENTGISRIPETNEVSYTDFGMYRSSSFIDDGGELEDISGVDDDFVVTALDSIRNLDNVEATTRISTPASKKVARSHREKSAMLLKQCSSWTQLDNNEEARALVDDQVIVANMRFGAGIQGSLSLTLRRSVVENGVETPFHSILSWLCQSGDYFTAASVALNLLHDTEAVKDLRRSPDAVEGEDDKSYLEGLLDGIIKLDIGLASHYSTSKLEEDSERAKEHSATITSLADMAVGCMIRGGEGMSRTLEGFLGRNPRYDSSRACLMLAATTSSAISDLEDANSASMTPVEIDSMTENVLWPIRCLLRIAVTRDCMPTALALLNATIPDEMRNRESKEVRVEDVYRPPVSLCTAIVKLIIASAPNSAGCLLNLTDEESSTSYWQSLDHDTQLAFSLVSIGGKYPLLREAEVRTWALDQVANHLDLLVSRNDVTNALDGCETLPSEWITELCFATLSNAGCHVEQPPSPRVYDAREGNDNETGFLRQNKIEVTEWLVSSPESGGIDFNLLITSLLSLERQSLQWNQGTLLSTQNLLIAVCDLAGRNSSNEPDFAFDANTTMKQCAIAENVPAAAALIGGSKGFVLQCANVLIQSLNLSMKEAESVLLKRDIIGEYFRDSDKVESIDGSPFVLTDGHRELLLLLEDHVLAVKTHGEFAYGVARGGIDPVFAARICFRAWNSLQQNGHGTSSSNTWLQSWLRRSLGISDEKGEPSKRKLACAALARALLWPDEDALVDYNAGAGKKPSILAETLGFDCSFLVQLSQSCCGLLESVPLSVLVNRTLEESGYLSPAMHT